VSPLEVGDGGDDPFACPMPSAAAPAKSSEGRLVKVKGDLDACPWYGDDGVLEWKGLGACHAKRSRQPGRPAVGRIGGRIK
jgi:hypothetical protein